MTTHELKTVQPHFAHVQSGAKRAEIRRDDRGFAVGDVLVLRELDPQRCPVVTLAQGEGKTRTAVVFEERLAS